MGNITCDTRSLLRALPSVEKLLKASGVEAYLGEYSRASVIAVIRDVLKGVRDEIVDGTLSGPVEEAAIVQQVGRRLRAVRESPLRSVVNATGTVLHTNLGRALLPQLAVEEVVRVASTAVTLEYDLEDAGRGDRDDLIEEDLVALTGAEAATVVNNNAAAVLLALNTVASGKDGIVSRGELIEIGGSFRIPDVMKKSGVRLREVGTTNRTHPKDYSGAISDETGVLLKVHTSNYRVVGFTAEVGLEELVGIGLEHRVPVMEDLGAGALVDLSEYGLPKEPVVSQRIAKGADIITFSGDKLLGGPQAGLIVGRKQWIDAIKKNPLKRALRLGKLSLAALSATLRLYRHSPDLRVQLPTLRLLTRPIAEMEAIGEVVQDRLQQVLGSDFSIEMIETFAQIGSGTLPEEELPSRAIAISHSAIRAGAIAQRFRGAMPPIIGRIRDNTFLLDLRAIFDPEDLVP